MARRRAAERGARCGSGPTAGRRYALPDGRTLAPVPGARTTRCGWCRRQQRRPVIREQASGQPARIPVDLPAAVTSRFSLFDHRTAASGRHQSSDGDRRRGPCWLIEQTAGGDFALTYPRRIGSAKRPVVSLSWRTGDETWWVTRNDQPIRFPTSTRRGESRRSRQQSGAAGLGGGTTRRRSTSPTPRGVATAGHHRNPAVVLVGVAAVHGSWHRCRSVRGPGMPSAGGYPPRDEMLVPAAAMAGCATGTGRPRRRHCDARAAHRTAAAGLPAPTPSPSFARSPTRWWRRCGSGIPGPRWHPGLTAARSTRRSVASASSLRPVTSNTRCSRSDR